MYILFLFVQQNQQKKSLEAKYDLLNDRFNILKKEFDKCEFELIASKEDNTQLLKKHEELITEKDVSGLIDFFWNASSKSALNDFFAI